MFPATDCNVFYCFFRHLSVFSFFCLICVFFSLHSSMAWFYPVPNCTVTYPLPCSSLCYPVFLCSAALQVALAHNSVVMTTFLKRRGADLFVLSSEEKALLVSATKQGEIFNHGTLNPVDFRRFASYCKQLPAPVKLRGCSYLSLHLQRHNFPENM